MVRRKRRFNIKAPICLRVTKSSFLLLVFIFTLIGFSSAHASLLKAHTIFSDATGSRFKPIAIYNDGASTTSLEVKRQSSGGSISGIFFAPLLSINGVTSNSGITVTLYDDGSHGDALANDSIYTLWPITSTATTTQFDGRIEWHTYSLSLDGDTISTKLGIVDSTIRFPTRTLGTDNEGAPVVATEWIVSIQDNAIVDGSMSGATAENYGSVSNKFYEFFDDQFDYLIMFSVLRTNQGTSTYVAIRNDVSGLGNSGFGTIFDISTYFIPANKNMGTLDGIAFINDGGTSVYGALHHELMHRWGIHFGSDLGFPFGGHWNGVINSSTYYKGNLLGVLGGAVVTENPDNTITITGGPTVKYPAIELYLMGLIPASEVPDYDFYLYEPTSNSIIEKFTLKIDDIVTEFGPRIPNSVDSQKEYKAAFIVISPPGEPLTQAEFALMSIAARHFESKSPGSGAINFTTTPASFTWATDFRATMVTRLIPVGTEIPMLGGIGSVLLMTILTLVGMRRGRKK